MKKRIDEIEFKISQGEMDAYQVFTQMRQLIVNHDQQDTTMTNETTSAETGAEKAVYIPPVAMLEQAPKNDLPTWQECKIRMDNLKHLEDNNLLNDDFYSDSNLPTPLHEFIYEYDCNGPYKSAWFLHRLEKLINHIKAEAEA